MNRAERRRLERALGRKRSDRKRGRRAAVRTEKGSGWRIPRTEVEGYEALEGKGFVVAKPQIVRPGVAGGDPAPGLTP